MLFGYHSIYIIEVGLCKLVPLTASDRKFDFVFLVDQ